MQLALFPNQTILCPRHRTAITRILMHLKRMSKDESDSTADCPLPVLVSSEGLRRIDAQLTRWKLPIPPTTGMPHRPSSSDGQPPVFVSSNPSGRRYRFAVGCPSLRLPQPRYRRLRFGCRSYRLSPPKDGAAWIRANPNQHGFTKNRGSRSGSFNPAIAGLLCRIYRQAVTETSPTVSPVFAPNKKPHECVAGFQTCIWSPRSSRRRRIAPAWIWLTLPSDMPNFAPIRDMVNPSKWYRRITAR